MTDFLTDEEKQGVENTLKGIVTVRTSYHEIDDSSIGNAFKLAKAVIENT